MEFISKSSLYQTAFQMIITSGDYLPYNKYQLLSKTARIL
jgi:hypothetical protein